MMARQMAISVALVSGSMMSDFTYYDRDTEIIFTPERGLVELMDAGQLITIFLPKNQAINLASKLLQWGTSS